MTPAIKAAYSYIKAAYSYIRFSTPHQAKGDSLRRQTEAAAEYCRNHGLTLDDGLTLRDLGVSAYRGDNASVGALGAFLTAVKDGRIAKGSTLIVESLDRLSRQEIADALELFLSIVRAGITIVTLTPAERFSRDSLDMTRLIIAITVMSRAHEESRTKAIRLKASWEIRRKEAAIHHRPVSKLPAWCRREGNKIALDPSAAKTVRQIFQWSIDGLGVNRIVRELQRLGIAAIGDRGKWSHPYIRKILTSRSAFGEYQPCQLVEGKRIPTGEAIADYYPAVVPQEIFFRSLQNLHNRLKAKGGYRNFVSNLFTGLVHCGTCGKAVGVYKVNRGENKRPKRLLCCASWRDGEKNCCRWSVQSIHLEQAILQWLREVTPEDLEGKAANQRQQIEALEGERASLAAKIKTIKNQIFKESDSVTADLLDVLKTLTARAEVVVKSLEALRHTAAKATQDVVGIAESLARASGDLALRLKAKALIASVVERIDLTVLQSGVSSACVRKVTAKVTLRTGVIRWVHFTTQIEGVKLVGVYEKNPARKVLGRAGMRRIDRETDVAEDFA